MPENVPLELYDMVADPGETNNLYEKRPEIARRLKQTYDDWFADVSNTRPDNYDPPRIVLGTKFETSTTLSTQDRRETEDGGEWLLDFRNGKFYDIEFLWKEPVASAQLELQIGSTIETLTVPNNSDTAFLKNISIPDGEQTLSAKVLKGSSDATPYHIILHQL